MVGPAEAQSLGSAATTKKPSLGRKPIFIQPITGCTVEHGEVARFHALVSGTPRPQISWFHNRQPVRPTKNVVFHLDEETNVATLIIVDAFSEHAGLYTCRATNTAGEEACSATLTVTTGGGGGKTWTCSIPASRVSVNLRGCPDRNS